MLTVIVLNLQSEIQRTTDILRSLEEPPPETPFNSRPYFSALSLDPNQPVSPRQMAQDDPRRPPYINAPPPQPQPPRQNFYRPPIPPHLSITPRRYGSVAGPSTASSPSSGRPQPPPSQNTLHPHSQTPQAPHPLSAVHSPPMGLSRRHTSADIRVHGWQPQASPFGSGQNSAQWPSSPKRGPIDNGQSLRDSLSTYSLTNATGGNLHPHSRPATPPSLTNGSSAESLGTWSWGPAGKGPFAGGSLFKGGDGSGPPTRRGSMAHILNPAVTEEVEEEGMTGVEEGEREEDRKRKRLA
jgi:hypothetical protein